MFPPWQPFPRPFCLARTGIFLEPLMDDPYRARCIAWLRAICFGEPRRPMPPLPARMPPPPDIRFDYLRRRAGLGPAGGVMGAAGSAQGIRALRSRLAAVRRQYRPRPARR